MPSGVAATLTSSQLHWIVRVTAGVCMALGVSAASHHFSTPEVGNALEVGVRLERESVDAPRATTVDDPSLILGAGLFCQGCPSGPPGATLDLASRAVEGVASSLPLTLLATAEARDPSESMATIIDRETSAVSAYGVGDELRKGVTISSIERGRVLLANHDRAEYLEIRADGAVYVPPPAAVAAPLAPSVPRGDAVQLECSHGEVCELPRALVREWVQRPELLAGQARVVPLQRDGQLEGLRVFGIQKDSIPARLGLRNGDTLRRVNGVALNDLDAVMGLYARLDQTSRVELELDRRGVAVQRVVALR